MIVFSKLGRLGRLGNQLFQIASTIGMALKTDNGFKFPHWVYAKYFKQSQNFNLTHSNFTKIDEIAFNYTPELIDKLKQHQNVDLFGYFQTEKYFEHCKPYIKEIFEFEPSFLNHVVSKYSFQIKNGKENIAISIRRGDYVNNNNYAQLPITWYFTALERNFPDWQNSNIIIFSDDIPYCKEYFHNFSNVYYSENEFNNNDKAKYFQENKSAIEQLCLMSLCDHFIIANSTFSWWGAWLGEKELSIVVRPKEHLKGNLAKHDTKDYYPEHWITHTEDKINLNDVTFIIPVSFDHQDRKQNLELNVCMLQKYFDTNIIVMEHGSDKFQYFQQYCKYLKCNYKDFHRTRMLNNMTKMSTTEIVVNWDADVFISPIQILYSVLKLRSKESDVVYPYDGRFARVNRLNWFKQLEKSLDVGIFSGNSFPGTLPTDKKSVGGAIFFNREVYLQGGGENENFIAYGPEDVEREVRFTRLGYKVFRTPGILYHMDHFKGVNSKCSTNKYDKQNHDELEKIYSFTQDELRNYVNNFKWK